MSRVRRWLAQSIAAGVVAAMVLLGAFAGSPAAASGPSPVPLGSAANFAILANQSITNTGPTTITGDMGLSPNGSSSVTTTGGLVVNGSQFYGDTVAQTAQTDLTAAIVNAQGQGPGTAESTAFPATGLTLGPGIYTSSSSMDLTGTVTLDAYGNSNAVFIFQMPSSTLTTASNSAVLLTGGAQACNVFWQVGSSATLGTDTQFVGTILASTSITLDTGATIVGRALASGGSVTLDNNTVTVQPCASTTVTVHPATTTLTTAASSSTITLGNSVTDVATVTSANGSTPSGSVQFYACAVGVTACTSTTGTALTPADTLVNGVATSPSVTPSAVGNYCFAAVYNPNSNAFATSAETSTATNTECFAVTATPVPTIGTQTSSPGFVLGSTVFDTATLTGTAAGGVPTGSVQFSICGPGSSLCAPALGNVLGTAQTVNALGVATSPSFTPTAAGTYCFSATYTPSGITYAGTSETGSTINAECFTVSAPATPPVVVVPPTHTGQPWAGWPYWLLVAAAGVLGLGLLSAGVYRRRQSR